MNNYILQVVLLIFILRSISQSALKATSILKYIYIFEIINYWTIHKYPSIIEIGYLNIDPDPGNQKM